jgi:hypothetical protein
MDWDNPMPRFPVSTMNTNRLMPSGVLDRVRRKVAFSDQSPPHFQDIGGIDRQYVDRRPTFGCDSDQSWTTSPEVLGPAVEARMIERYQCSALGIDTGDIRPLIQIAPRTG